VTEPLTPDESLPTPNLRLRSYAKKIGRIVDEYIATDGQEPMKLIQQLRALQKELSQ
jgi:hypothetical protein